MPNVSSPAFMIPRDPQTRSALIPSDHPEMLISIQREKAYTGVR